MWGSEADLAMTVLVLMRHPEDRVQRRKAYRSAPGCYIQGRSHRECGIEALCDIREKSGMVVSWKFKKDCILING